MSDDLARRLRNLQESLRDGDIDEADYEKGIDRLRQRFGASAVDTLLSAAPQPEPSRNHTLSMSDSSRAEVAVAGHVYGNIFIAGRRTKSATQLLAGYLARLRGRELRPLPCQLARKRPAAARCPMWPRRTTWRRRPWLPRRPIWRLPTPSSCAPRSPQRTLAVG
jgi:hypothetical protein